MNFEPAPLQPAPASAPIPAPIPLSGEDLLPQPPETAPTLDPARKIVPEPREIMPGLRLAVAIINSLAVFPALFGQAMLAWLLIMVVGSAGGGRSMNPEAFLGAAVVMLAIGYSLLGYWFLFGYWFFSKRSSHRRMARFWWGSTIYNAILTGIYGVYCALAINQMSSYFGTEQLLGFLPFSLTAAMTCVSIAFARAHGGAHKHEMEIMSLARRLPEEQRLARMEAIALGMQPPR